VPGGSDPQFVAVGDSLTFGVGATGGCTYPNILAAQLGSPWGGYNQGVPGWGLDSMIGAAASQVDPLYNASHSQNVVILWGGTNDIDLGSSAATVYGKIVTYGTARHAAHPWKVGIMSILPRSSSNPNFETVRQALRTLLLADFTVATANPNAWLPGPGITYADAFYDVGNDPVIGQASDQLTTWYQPDHIHLSDGANGIVATGVQAMIGVM